MGQETLSSTIVAVSTPPGVGGIAVIRLSGPEAFSILGKRWKGADPTDFRSHTAHLGWIVDSEGNEVDQVIATVYRNPDSYTGEDVVEISCHGSTWIQKSIVDSLIDAGASPAGAGEFTRRAFMNGRLDLAQAEGVADMIAASSKAAARLAATQLKGDYSRRLESLRRRLVDLGVLLELELDFAEEDVEFADRTQLIVLATQIKETVEKLSASFKAGNAFKNGIPVAIAGVPNVGKSSLLNSLLGEDKAIVSEIPGTTRDAIEDTIEIDGILFRFIDTAGLRDTSDRIEKIGVDLARRKIGDSSIVLYLVDPTQNVARQLILMKEEKTGERTLLVSTKSDISGSESDDSCIAVSALTGSGMDVLKKKLVDLATEEYNPQHELIVTNARHHEALKKASEPLGRLIAGLESGVSADFLSQDLREADRYLGEITGAVSSDEILHSIFSRYCIGK